jgi:hypothetical protein
VVKSEIENGVASLRSTATWNNSIVNAGNLQSRLTIASNIDGEVLLGARMKWDLELLRFTAEFYKSGNSSYGFGRAFRVDVKSKRSITVAVMNGIDGMNGRLYQLLPTARGYRLFSVGDTKSRALITFEIIPDKLVISVEKDWYMRENITSTHRISIRLEGQ